MKNKIINIALFGLLITVSTSCSVVMAANKQGTDVTTMQTCRTRGQILAYGPTIISSNYTECGELIETYQIQKPRGSAARALMHGLLDVGTCGLWEVVGTPIEACVDQKEFVAFKVIYDSEEKIQRIELL